MGTWERWRERAVLARKIALAVKRDPSSLRNVLVALPHDDIYDRRYFDHVEVTTKASADAMAASIVASFAPRRVVDLGCGTGALLERLRSLGVEVMGLEHARAALEWCRGRDLDVEPFDLVNDELPPRFTDADVAVSMNVGQQLPPEHSGRLVDLLCSMAPVVVFCSGLPGQDDALPLNEQPFDHWIRLFAARGYRFDEAESLAWREDWKAKQTSPWFFDNVMILRRDRTG